ncbi:MAG TPA: maltotransferase domain-containing protein, partial [Candidatus Limnocylindria bacterium]|nr:maltotransferase domain-containing protein [Candidatus Limnocylindria bacterium]
MTTTRSRPINTQASTPVDGDGTGASTGPLLREPDAEAIGTRRTIVIERIEPQLDSGRDPVKRVVGDELLVTADIFGDGHDLLDA